MIPIFWFGNLDPHIWYGDVAPHIFSSNHFMSCSSFWWSGFVHCIPLFCVAFKIISSDEIGKPRKRDFYLTLDPLFSLRDCNHGFCRACFKWNTVICRTNETVADLIIQHLIIQGANIHYLSLQGHFSHKRMKSDTSEGWLKSAGHLMRAPFGWDMSLGGTKVQRN